MVVGQVLISHVLIGRFFTGAADTDREGVLEDQRATSSSASTITPSPRAQIAQEQDAYRDQARADGWDVLARKLGSAHWRSRMRDQLLAQEGLGDEDAHELVSDLIALGVHLDDAAMSRLCALVSDPALRAQVLAAQGKRAPDVPELHEAAGPDLDLKIEVNRDSPWHFERWREQTGFSEYHFDGEGVRYRGLHLQPGDLLLPNVNLDGNFIYSSLSEPKGFCPHSAVFVILEHGGRRFPAVIETYEKGLRAVPLCVFLNARYISYAEIYRHREMDAAARGRASAVAWAATGTARGYNFDTTDADKTYVCCTSVAQQFFEGLGLTPVSECGAIRDAGVRSSMQALDYPHLDAFLTPVDFVLSPQFEFVGRVDNGQSARLVAREFVERRFRHCFSTGEIRHERLPFMVKLNHFGIRQMRARTLLGRFVSLVMGFDHADLPKGPDRILAIVEPLEDELGAAVRALIPEVERRLAEMEQLDIQAFLDDPELSARTQALLPMRWLVD